tara:strand:- start:1498 stop:1878 length:381 start_codon:yes stop_codon:yes gene_type:complete
VIFVSVCNVDLPVLEAGSHAIHITREASGDIMEDKKAAQPGSEKLMKYGMWACCAVMILPIIAFLAAGRVSGVSSSLITFAPLLLCVGVHLVMHRYMGKSCHGKSRVDDNKHEAPEDRAGTRIAAE